MCEASQITQDLTLKQGKGAGNFTDIGDVGDFQMCITRCCQSKSCDLAYKSGETCFLVHCFSSDSCQTSPSISPLMSPKMCFVKRHVKDEISDGTLTSCIFPNYVCPKLCNLAYQLFKCLAQN